MESDLVVEAGGGAGNADGDELGFVDRAARAAGFSRGVSSGVVAGFLDVRDVVDG